MSHYFRKIYRSLLVGGCGRKDSGLRHLDRDVLEVNLGDLHEELGWKNTNLDMNLLTYLGT